ncbi:MAG: lamin tail domain-containing protein [Endomicrobia bacterium]|nr:lamin tail domain-containing protein [Endomicrobiia bacterium]
MSDFISLSYTTSVVTNSFSYQLLYSSTYYWRVFAIDRANNYSLITTTFVLVVDTIPPQVPILLNPANNSATNYLVLNFEWSSQDIGPAGIKGYEFYISTTSDFSVFISSKFIQSNKYEQELSEGVYYWRVRTYDNASNFSSYASYFTVIVDTTSPQTPVLVSPTDDTRTNSTNITFQWNPVSDFGPAGTSYYRLEISTQISFATIYLSSITNLQSTSHNLQSENIYYWRVTVFDKAGNYSTSTSSTITIDFSRPTIVDNQPGDDIWRVSTGTYYNVQFYDEPQTTSAGLAYAEYSVYSSTTPLGLPSGVQLVNWQRIFEYSLPQRTTYYTLLWTLPDSVFSSLQQGYNFVFVRCTDLAGNTSNYATYVFYVKKDTATPTVVSYEPQIPSWDNTQRLHNVDFYDYESGLKLASYTVYSQTDQQGLQLIPWTTVFVLTPAQNVYTTDWYINFSLLQPGTNYVSIHCEDNVGNFVIHKDIFKVFKDTIAPNNITDLTSVQGVPAGSVKLQWTSPSDDTVCDPNNIKLKNYLVKYKTSSFVNRDDFLLTGTTFYVSSPSEPSKTETVTITGLVEGTTYWIGVLPQDKANNYSLLVATTSNWAKRISPAKITTLTGFASDTLDPAEVELSWISVGDDDYEGQASGYVIKYATYPFTESMWDSLNEYPQSWLPKPAGQLESYILLMPQPNTTYYFAIKVYDDAQPTANYSVMSNTVAVCSRPRGPADGILVYAEGSVSNPRYYNTTSAGASWTGPYNANTTAANINWVVLRACNILRNEKLLATLSSNGAIYIQRYDGTAGNWSTPELLTIIDPSNAAYRCVDIAYEQNSARALVVFSSGSLTGQVWYRIWSSTANFWVSPSLQLTIPQSTGFVRWVRLEPRPATDEIMLVVLDSNNDIFAYRWNGSSWVNNQQLTINAYTSLYQCFDIAWENTRGNCIILWGEGTATRYAMWSSTASIWISTNIAGPNIASTTGATWIKLASDRTSGSDRIAMCSLDADSDWNVAIWQQFSSSYSWTSPRELSATMDAINTRLVDIAWEKDTGRCITVGVLSATPARYPNYSIWSSASGWSTLVQDTGYDLGANTDLRWLQLIPDPNSSKMVLLGANAASAGSVSLRTRTWSGSSWVGGTALTSLGSTNAYEFFMLALDLHDIIPPTFVDAQIGDDIWRSTNNATYKVYFYDTGGSKLSRIQTQLATGPNNSGIYRSWANEIIGLNTEQYTTDWSFSEQTWQQLLQGQSYVSLRIFDGAGNYTILQDAFYVKKDTQPPQIVNNLPSDSFATWYNVNLGNVIDIDFYDQTGLSLLATAYYITTVSTSPIFTYSANRTSYISNWGINTSDWNLLPTGTNYFIVRCFDVAGNKSEIINAFKILKDTIPPQQVNDLFAEAGPVYGSIKLTWSKPQDSGSGVELYEIYYSTYENFDISSTIISYATLSTSEMLVLTNLNVETTYYFRLRTRDKVSIPPNQYYNWSVVSNTSFCKPQKGNIWINEIYAYGSAGNDWIELYNNLQGTVSLTGWQLKYAGNTIWTGSSNDKIEPLGCFVITGLNLNHTISGDIVLLTNTGLQVNKVIYPAHSQVVSYSRITDGNLSYFEFDPTPTQGVKNQTEEYTQIKINEVHYSSNEQFIELFNISYVSTITFSGYLRNSSNKPFKFTRKLYPRSFAIIDFSSVDEDGYTFFDKFGTLGLNSYSDFVVLESSNGQIIDRITYQYGTSYLYRNEIAQYVSYLNSQVGNVANDKSLSRTIDGVDSDIDSIDFAISSKSYGARNIQPTLPMNYVLYPQNNTVLPRRFKFEVQLSTNYSSGFNNTLWFIRTGGANDTRSPHQFRLQEFGINISSAMVMQIIKHIGADLKDVDGYSLSTATIYKVVLNTESDFAISPQIVISTVTYDATVHSLEVTPINFAYANEDKYYPLLRFKLKNNSPLWSNPIALKNLYLKFLTSDSQPLSTDQAKLLFNEITLFVDNGDDVFYVDFDTNVITTIEKSVFYLDNNGGQLLDLAIDEVVPQTTKTYFLTVKMSTSAKDAIPSTFKAAIAVGTTDTVWIEVNSDIEQPSEIIYNVTTSTPVVIRPLKPPLGTQWPYVLEKPTVINKVDHFNGDIFVCCGDGTLIKFSSNGVLQSSFVANGSIISSIFSNDWTGENGYLYFGTGGGSIYKNYINNVSQNVWTRSLSDEISSEVAGYYFTPPAKIYAGTKDGYVFKISTGSQDLWSPVPQLYGSIVKEPSIDEGFTEYEGSGVNSIWWGTSQGYVYRLNLQDGSILASISVSSSVTSKIEYDAGYYNKSLNTLNVYFGTSDGKIYCRYGLNLNTVPLGWNDVVLNSRVNEIIIWEEEWSKKYIYASCDDGVYKIDASSGGIVWQFKTQAPVKKAVVPPYNNGYLYFGTDDGFVFAIHKDDRTLNSGYPIYVGAPVTAFNAVNKKIICGKSSGVIDVYEEK